MNNKNDIPVFSTQDLWKKYVESPLPLEEVFRQKPEEFLIVRLEDFVGKTILPTPPHRRNVNELVILTKGTLVRGCNLNKIVMQPGDAHLLLENQISTVDAISADAEGFYCHFSLETIIRLYHKEHMVNELGWLGAHLQTKPARLSGKALHSVKGTFERLVDEYENGFDLNLIDAYLVTLCFEIKNSIQDHVSVEAVSKAFELTEMFKNLVLKQIHQHQSVSYYASHLGVSPNHLNKVVKQTTGKPASTLISDLLVLEAKVLLRHSELSISEIAFKLGFSDHSYFSRFFKKETGFSPRDYKLSK